MASAQNPVLGPQTKEVQHNHIIIKYQQPPDLAIINHALEILVAVTRSFTKKNPVQIPYTQDYIDQIIPFLQTLYSQSAQWVLQQGGVPPQLPIPSTYHVRYCVPKFPHSSATFNIIVGSHIQAFS